LPNHSLGKKELRALALLRDEFQLTDNMCDVFKKYIFLLLEWNKRFNLTRITDIQKIIECHFRDSLIVSKYIDISSITGVVDVGTGAGFPGIPLKIVFPDISLVLIEVNTKKIKFLEMLITEFQLTSVEIYDADWRSFIRNTQYDVQLICARASLRPIELIRALKPASFYRNATIVYWAAETWQPDKKEAHFLEEVYPYCIQGKKRKLVMFKN